MHLGRVSFVKQGEGTIRDDRLVAPVEMLGGVCKVAVRSGDERVHRQQAIGVLGDSFPVSGCFVQLHEPEVGRRGVAVASREFLQDCVLGGGIVRQFVDGSQQHVGVLRSDIFRVKCLQFEQDCLGLWPFPLDNEPPRQPLTASETIGMDLEPGLDGLRIGVVGQFDFLPCRSGGHALGFLSSEFGERPVQLI